MALVKTATNPNNTCSSSDAYIIDRKTSYNYCLSSWMLQRALFPNAMIQSQMNNQSLMTLPLNAFVAANGNLICFHKRVHTCQRWIRELTVPDAETLSAMRDVKSAAHHVMFRYVLQLDAIVSELFILHECDH